MSPLAKSNPAASAVVCTRNSFSACRTGYARIFLRDLGQQLRRRVRALVVDVNELDRLEPPGQSLRSTAGAASTTLCCSLWNGTTSEYFGVAADGSRISLV